MGGEWATQRKVLPSRAHQSFGKASSALAGPVLAQPDEDLDAQPRAQPGPRFGADFSRVPAYAGAGPAPPAQPRSVPAGRLGRQAFDRAVAADGRPVPSVIRTPLEQSTGLDLGEVKVHAGHAAAAAAALAGARAVTFGDHVILGAGEPDPGSAQGRRLLAHELAHVALRRSADYVHPGWSSPGDAHERDAEALSAGAVPAAVTTAPAAARQARAKGGQLTEADLMIWLAGFRQSNPAAFEDWIAANEGKLYGMLSRYGFKGSWVKPEAYLADFDRAFDKWLGTSPGARLLLPSLPSWQLSPETIKQREAEDNEQVMGELPDGTPYNTTRRNLRAMRQQMYWRRSMQTLGNIESGLGGTIGWALGGDEGSDLGATLGDLAGAGAGVLEGRQAVRDVGASLGTPRSTTAEVRSASPPPDEPHLTGETAPLRVVPSAPVSQPAPAARGTPTTEGRPLARGATAEGSGADFSHEYHPVPAAPVVERKPVPSRGPASSARPPAAPVAGGRTPSPAPTGSTKKDVASVIDEATQGTGRATRSPADPDELNAAAGHRAVDAEEVQALSPRYAGDRFDAATSEEELAQLAQEVLPGYSYDPATRGRIILRGGRQVTARSAGSTVPDLYLRGRRARAGDPRLPPISLEAKNYLVSEQGVYETFIQATVKQAQQRAAALPKTAQQYLLIDLRGQDVTRGYADALRRDLAARSNGLLRYDRIYFLPRSLE